MQYIVKHFKISFLRHRSVKYIVHIYTYYYVYNIIITHMLRGSVFEKYILRKIIHILTYKNTHKKDIIFKMDII